MLNASTYLPALLNINTFFQPGAPRVTVVDAGLTEQLEGVMLAITPLAGTPTGIRTPSGWSACCGCDPEKIIVHYTLFERVFDDGTDERRYYLTTATRTTMLSRCWWTTRTHLFCTTLCS
jgi:hypothetical protein